VIGLLWSILTILVSPCRSNARLEAENAVLRHQLLVLHRKCRGRVRLTNFDRWIFVELYRLFPSVLQVLHVIRPETLVRWHRTGFRSYWRWKSRYRGGRPQIDTDLRALIRQMRLENPLWGAPRIHGELLKLGFEVAQSTVAKYMADRHDRPPGQSWWTFLRNHMPEIAAMDVFVVPTLAFSLLYGFIIVRRARLDWRDEQSDGRMDCTPDHRGFSLGISTRIPHPRPRSRFWLNRTTAPPGDGHSRQAIAPRSPWQNGFAERLIGSIRRECLDHIIILGHLRQVLLAYASYYNGLALTGLWTRTRPRADPFRGLAGCNHVPFRADFITNTSGSSFRYTQAPANRTPTHTGVR
jgi:integrase-like protein